MYIVKRNINTEGWLANHIKKKHDEAHQLDQDITVLKDCALDLSTNEAVTNLADNSAWGMDSSTVSSAPTSTPQVSRNVRLCPTANTFIKNKGKSLPASFLTALLPAPGFLDNLDKSLLKENNSTILLDRSQDESHCFKCEVCHFPF